MSKRLSPREASFLAAYITNGGDGQAAAISAGYKPHSAKFRASKLLAMPHVRAELERRQEKVLVRAEVTAADVIRGLANIARADIRKLFDAEGKLVPIHQLDDETAQALAGVDHETIFAGSASIGTVRKFKRFDAVRAYELLARHFGLLHDNLHVSGDFADRLVKARERARKAHATG